MSNPTEFGTNNLPDLDKLEADMRSNPAAAYAILDPKAVLQLIAAARRAQPEVEAPQAEPPRMSTDESREYLIKFMEKHFTDRTYHRYIRGERGSVNLAGDFAWQMARTLRMLERTPAATLSPLCGAKHAESGKESGVVEVVENGPLSARVYFGTVDERDRFIARGAALAAQQAAAPGALAQHCPFCGSTDEVYHGKVTYCDNCGADGPSNERDGQPVAKWSDRVAPSAPGTPEARADIDYSIKKGDTVYTKTWRLTPLEVVDVNWALRAIAVRLGPDGGVVVWPAAGMSKTPYDQRAAQLDGGQEGSGSNG